MAENKIPEAWIGDEVVLQYWDGSEPQKQLGLLEVVDDHGLVLNIRERMRFYPWGTITHMQKRPERPVEPVTSEQ